MWRGPFYMVLSTLSISTLIVATVVGGLLLKQERKITVAGVVHPGCYRWSDGTVTCEHGWRKLTEDQLYGCTPANEDKATGECH